MRSITPPLTDVLRTLGAFLGESERKPALEALCQVELGLYLQQKLMPGSSAGSAWVLFSGYGFAEAYGAPLPPDTERTLRTARYSLWTLRRSRTWREALESYQMFDPRVRGYDVPDTEAPATRRELSVATDRFPVYERLLRTAPPLAGKCMPVAGQGPHAFPVSRTMAVVDLPSVPHTPVVAHDMDLQPTGGGEPLVFTRKSLERTAAEMDATHARAGEGRPPRWLERLRAFDLSTREDGAFHKAGRDEDFTFTVDGIQHLLGIVGAGKSTLRDIIAVHLAKLGKRTTIVVTDVAEVLKLVRLYNLHTDGAAAPVLGSSGRERHAQRLHRRLAGRGEHRLLAHDDPAFAYLGTSCLLNIRRQGATLSTEQLAFGEAPCSRLRPPSDPRRGKGGGHASEWQKRMTSCPYWSVCPRHHGARALVGALIWVATPAGLVDASPPRPQNGERIRYLELACRRSDLVIIDEADRVQMQLDHTFAPAVVLASDEDKGLIDQLSRHKIRELAASGRTQLSERDVETFAAALNTAGSATDRLYAMLVAGYELRDWVRVGYFSAWTLQLKLLDERYEIPDDSGPEHDHHAPRQALGKLLDAFRDNPFGDRSRRTEEDFSRLTALLNELLHTGNPENTRRHLTEVMDDVFRIDPPYMAARKQKYKKEYEEWQREEEDRQQKRGRRRKPKPPPQTPEQWRQKLAERFEFTLLLSALEPRLAMINAMWPRVEAALSLGYNAMYRRPLDYGPMVPEAPMGNVLGFQFRVPGEDEGGVRSGELTFFRCSGVGRELLRSMPHLASVDGRPGAHLLLLSGSSWAGASSRYHVCVPVGVIIEPPTEVTERIADESLMRFEFIDDGDEKLRLSGTRPDDRPEKLRRIATHLGAGEYDALEGGPLERELLSLPSGRDQILLLVGSYAEARIVADTLHNLNSRWRESVLCLISDDEEIGPEDEAPSAYRARSLRRGDVEHLKDLDADILVAPLLAVERGHNILNDDDEAAIGTVYFLARPNPHPEDLHLAVHAVNDWIVRAVTGGDFATWVQEGNTVEEGADEVRRLARSRWYQVLERSMAWSRLGDTEREQVTWDMLVLMWQVIGRLVRGGVPARVVFVDAAFAPNLAAATPRPDTPVSSLLRSVLDVLDPYFEGGAKSAEEQFIARALYGPLRSMLTRLLSPTPAPDHR
ncbi:pPIWI_RE_Z domain-containing protein [Streptomyces cyaneofuscatus]|uniref:pPIWI_RE_Z domain-containing protein n=1 Tax=Streptomyces cyaneofuscatus TaxID=66883 RepID=UPI00380F141D